MALTCLAADMVSGRIIADLPSCEISQWPIRHTLSTYDNAAATLYLNGAPPNWQQAVKECATWLAFYEDTDPKKAIQWCGYVNTASPSAATDSIGLTLVTAEGYTDRRYSDTRTWTTVQHRDDIVASVMHLFVIDGSEPGIPLQLAYTAGHGTKPTAPIAWLNSDNASILTRLGQLFGQLGGDWTIDWGWSVDGMSIVPTMRFGDHIGTSVVAGLGPAVTFDMPGPLVDVQVVRDYSSGKGANKIIMYSSGQGTSVPMAPAVFAADFEGRPTFEERHQPASSIGVAALTQYGQQALPIRAPGAQSVTLTASLAASDGRRFGQDWFLGDDVGYRVGTDLDGSVIPAFPDGLNGVGRVLAVEFGSPDTISPILADVDIYTAVES